MVYTVPKSKASIKQNQFIFEIDGKQYSVPLLKYLSGDTVQAMADMELRGGMSAAAANYLMFGPADSPIGRAVRSLDQEQLGELAEAWAKESGIDTGKLDASTPS